MVYRGSYWVYISLIIYSTIEFLTFSCWGSYLVYRRSDLIIISLTTNWWIQCLKFIHYNIFLEICLSYLQIDCQLMDIRSEVHIWYTGYLIGYYHLDHHFMDLVSSIHLLRSIFGIQGIWFKNWVSNIQLLRSISCIQGIRFDYY